jgi:hypothetical protein
MCSFCTSEIDSTPPPPRSACPSTMICLAAVAMAMSPEEHCRSMLMPDTVVGRPARRAACRADVHALGRSLLEARTHDHVVDLGRVDAGPVTACAMA